MKLLSQFALAVLLIVVAFAGLSPPTRAKEKQNAIASTSYVQPDMAVEVRGVRATSDYKEKMIATAAVAVLTETKGGKNEVAARARNGSFDSRQSVNLDKSALQATVDIGAVLRL